MSGDRAGERDQFLALLDQEIERRARQAEPAAVGGDPLRWLMQTIDEMAARMRAAPDYVEPSPDERSASMRNIKSWLRSHGYLRG